MGFFGNLFGKNGLKKALDPFELIFNDDPSNIDGFVLPEFQEDKDYRETQDILKKFGTDLLNGDIPEYYAEIGKTGGPEFENYLSLLKGDIQGSVEDSAAATGRRGGSVQSSVAKQVGEATTKVRYEDYLRSLEGKKALLNTGIGVTEGVRGAGQTQQAQVNDFNFNRSKLDLSYRQLLDEQDAQEGDIFGKLASTALNAGVGFVTGGPVGALVGATSGFDFTSLLGGQETKSNQVEGVTKDNALELGKIDLSDYLKPFKAGG